MNLGWCDVCINVQDLEESRSFYETLGMEAVEGNFEEGYFVMVKDSARIGLYKGHGVGFMFNFRGGDVMTNAEALKTKGLVFDSGPTIEKDGSAGATVFDPDGNIIYLNTHPDELEPDYQKKVRVK